MDSQDQDSLKSFFNFTGEEKIEEEKIEKTVNRNSVSSLEKDLDKEVKNPIIKIDNKSRKTSLVSTIINFFFTLVLLMVLAAGCLVSVIPKVQRGASLTVTTQSMEPKIHPGDLVAVAPRECKDLQIGDIITYHPYPNDSTSITHRILSKRVGGKDKCVFTVKGDNNSTPDSIPVRFEMIVGKVLYVIPKLGFLSQGLGGKTSYAAPILGSVLILYSVFLFFKPRDKKVDEKKTKGE